MKTHETNCETLDENSTVDEADEASTENDITNKPKGKHKRIKRLRRKNRALIILSLLVFLFIALLTYMFFETTWIQVKTEIVPVKDLPTAFDGFKLVFISDLHADSVRDREFLRKQIQKINTMKPDIILLGGDYAETLSDFEATVHELEDLEAKSGIFAVLGNHDSYAGKLFKPILNKANITAGVDELFTISRGEEKIYISCLDEYYIGSSKIKNALKDVHEDEMVIMLSHTPQMIAKAAKQGSAAKVDLALCGHTHGGQVTVFGLKALLTRREMPGLQSWVDIGGIRTLESNGIGQFWDFRFFARPQIHEITLKCAE